MRRAQLIIWTILALFIYSSTSFASEISLHKVEIRLGEDGTASILAEVRYAKLTTSDVPYFVLGRAYDVEARDEHTQLECRTFDQPYGTYISCIPPANNLENYTVYFTFRLKGLVAAEPTFNRFVYSYGVKEPTDQFTLKLYLPEGYGLVKTNEEQVLPYFPQGASIGSDGRHVTLEWDLIKPQLGSTLTFSVMYEHVGIKPYNTAYYLLPFLAAAALIAFLLFRFRKAKDVLSVLTEDERKVIEVIRAKGKKYVKQRDIVRMTNFSKAKVSRILAALEERGLVKRERVGRTNRVKLSRKL